MKPFKNIIVGVDFSDYSKIVSKQAIKLAEFYEAQLTYVHAISSALYTADIRIYYDVTNDIMDPMEREVVSFYRLEKLKYKPRVIVTMATPTALISSVAKRTSDVLVVIGHRGQTKLGRFFLGSNAEELALNLTVPVWIHRGENTGIPKKILLPCDFSTRSKASLKLAQSFANGTKPALEFYHVSGAPMPFLDIDVYQKVLRNYNSAEKEKRQRFRSVFPRVPLKTDVGDVVSSIIDESKKFDLIAIAPHNRRGLFSRFGSVTGKIVRSGSTPVLISR